MELSMFEIALLAWCFIATSCWLDARQDARKAKFVLTHLVENDEVRDMIVQDIKKLRQLEEQNATN